MKTPALWPEFRISVESRSVEPVKRLRDDQGSIVQYFDPNGSERLAIHSKSPYGVLSGQRRPELMDVVEDGRDYSIFDVPEDTLALKAATMGTGRYNTPLLCRTYQQIGRALGRLIREVCVPLLGANDFAVVRSSANVLFIPPVHFGTGSRDPDAHGDSLSEDMHNTFAHQRGGREMHELSIILRTGIRDAFGS